MCAGIVLARAGLSTLLIEAHTAPGGGARTAALTLPGFSHDVCSTVHPLGVASPFLRTLGLEQHGVTWCDPPLPLAHVLRDGSAVALARSVAETAKGLGEDEQAYLDECVHGCPGTDVPLDSASDCAMVERAVTPNQTSK